MKLRCACQGLFLASAVALVMCLALSGNAGCGTQMASGGSGGGVANDNSDGGGGADGSALFAANCAACHGADAMGTQVAGSIVGASANEINEALNEVQAMANVNVTADEVDAIATYLAS